MVQKTVVERFAEVSQKTNTEQAKWFLNGFWDEFNKDKEQIWELVHKFIEIQLGEPVRYGRRMKSIEEGCDLDELQSHQLLEALGEVLTVKELRQKLLALDIDNNKRMSLSEYLLFKYDKSPKELVESPQGNVDKAKLRMAEIAAKEAGEALENALQGKDAASQSLLEATTTQHISAAAHTRADNGAKAAAGGLEGASNKAEAAASKKTTALTSASAASVALEKATVAKEEADAAKSDADAKEEKATAAHARVKVASDALAAAEADLKEAMGALVAEEKVIADKLAALQAKIEDPASGLVAKNRAKNELEQVKSEDPLPLRKAKITQQAALKKAERQRVSAQLVTSAAAKVLEEASAAAAEAATRKEEAEYAQALSQSAKQQADADAEAASKAADEASEAEKEAAELKQQADAAAAEAARSAEAAKKAKLLSEQAKQAAEEAAVTAATALSKAQAIFEELKQGSGAPFGDLWWMERVLEEKRKFM